MEYDWTGVGGLVSVVAAAIYRFCKSEKFRWRGEIVRVSTVAATKET